MPRLAWQVQQLDESEPSEETGAGPYRAGSEGTDTHSHIHCQTGDVCNNVFQKSLAP